VNQAQPVEGVGQRSGEPLLTLHNGRKRYGSVVALDGVDLTIRANRVLALVGDNGAGKSTLVKALAGTGPLDAGDITVDGRAVAIRNPAEAAALGIETVYQDLALCDNLSVVANLYLGRELRRPRPWRLLARARMQAQAGEVIRDLAVHLPDLDRPVATLSGGQRQAVAVSRAVLWGSRIVLLDEPTAALGVEQTAMVYRLVRRLRDRGLGVVLISHNLSDVFAVADEIAVLRLGRNAGTFRPGEDSVESVVSAITGGNVVPGANLA
jgi:D-xylose transport system ATP-binding protein